MGIQKYNKEYEDANENNKMEKEIGQYREGIPVSTENLPAFNFSLLKIPLTSKDRSKAKDCINMVQGNEHTN